MVVALIALIVPSVLPEHNARTYAAHYSGNGNLGTLSLHYFPIRYAASWTLQAPLTQLCSDGCSVFAPRVIRSGILLAKGMVDMGFLHFSLATNHPRIRRPFWPVTHTTTIASSDVVIRSEPFDSAVTRKCHSKPFQKMTLGLGVTL